MIREISRTAKNFFPFVLTDTVCGYPLDSIQSTFGHIGVRNFSFAISEILRSASGYGTNTFQKEIYIKKSPFGDNGSNASS